MWPFPKKPQNKEKQHVPNDGAWRRIIAREPYAGAWQHNDELTTADGLSYPTVFACVTRIAEDLAKMSLRYESKDSAGVYAPAGGRRASLLKRPNDYQTTQKFLEAWETSVQSRGNAYIYKALSGGQVRSLHVLNPTTTRPLVSPSGAVFYDLAADPLAEVDVANVVPADRIIHDRINCLYHPLVGISPLYAVALTVLKSMSIGDQSYQMFKNGGAPIGVLSIPGALSEEKAKAVQENWNDTYSGSGRYKTAVLGDGAEYKPVAQTAEDSQMVEQLKFGASEICSVFKVPQFKVGVGTLPTYNNVEALNTAYFTDCIQSRVMSIQNALNRGLDVPANSAFRFDLDALLLMDTKTKMSVAKEAVSSAIYSPDEARRKFGMPAVEGGDSPYLQQQNYSLAALAKRDAQEDPFNPGSPAEEASPEEEQERDYSPLLKAFEEAHES